ncbi:MAG: hypothetical protein PHO63_00615 [Bacilli bacterium]|nr:hypothetical protein [Bacilli bacterium]MDD4809463.1 hypothetical protein [Bacilli bacterium]
MYKILQSYINKYYKNYKIGLVLLIIFTLLMMTLMIVKKFLL